jgi:hypothetical protein
MKPNIDRCAGLRVDLPVEQISELVSSPVRRTLLSASITAKLQLKKTTGPSSSMLKRISWPCAKFSVLSGKFIRKRKP